MTKHKLSASRVENIKVNTCVGGAMFIGFGTVIAISSFGTSKLIDNFIAKSAQAQADTLIVVAIPVVIGIMMMVGAACYEPPESRRNVGL